MPVPNRFILHQAPVLAAIGRSVLSSFIGSKKGASSGATAREGRDGHAPREIAQTLPPRNKELVRCYVRTVGGDPQAYRGVLPPHLFPQWGFPLATRVLAGIDYPLTRVLNAGCQLTVHAPLPDDEPLLVRACLESVDDDGRRALLKTRIVTGTRSAPDALEGLMVALIPLSKGKDKQEPKEKKEPPRVPPQARELAFFKLRASAGLEYAKLTGDFNPIHWVPAYARAAGFRSCILHGFATMAHAMEGLNKNLFSGDVQALRHVDVSFVSPLVLPAQVGLYLDDQHITVGDGPGGRAYLTGTFETR